VSARVTTSDERSPLRPKPTRNTTGLCRCARALPGGRSAPEPGALVYTACQRGGWESVGWQPASSPSTPTRPALPGVPDGAGRPGPHSPGLSRSAARLARARDELGGDQRPREVSCGKSTAGAQLLCKLVALPVLATGWGTFRPALMALRRARPGCNGRRGRLPSRASSSAARPPVRRSRPSTSAWPQRWPSAWTPPSSSATSGTSSSLEPRAARKRPTRLLFDTTTGSRSRSPLPILQAWYSRERRSRPRRSR
jgi:hypothetical protein